MKLLLKKVVIYFIIIIPSVFFAAVGKFFKKILFNIETNKNPKKVIIFQMGHLGDFICTQLLLENIRLNFPNACIVLVVGSWNEMLAKKVPWVDKVIVFDNFFCSREKNFSLAKFWSDLVRFLFYLYKEKFDIGIDLRGHLISLFPLYLSNIKEKIGFNYKMHGVFLDKNIKFRCNTYESYRLLDLLKLMGLKTMALSVELNCFFEPKIKEAKFYISNKIQQKKPLIALFPGAPFKPRRWATHNFARLADKIIIDGLGDVLLLGGDSDALVIGTILAYMSKSPIVWYDDDIFMLTALIKSSDCFISNDTGPMHLSLALGIKTIGIFGPGDSKRWFPENNKNSLLIKSYVACSPCKLNSDVCNSPDVACMDRISVRQVVEGLKGLLYA